MGQPLVSVSGQESASQKKASNGLAWVILGHQKITGHLDYSAVKSVSSEGEKDNFLEQNWDKK